MLDFKALLFDLDGTLLDTAPDFITALNKQLGLHGRAPLPDHAIRSSVTNGSVGLIQEGFGMAPDHVQFETLREEFLELPFWLVAYYIILVVAGWGLQWMWFWAICKGLWSVLFPPAPTPTDRS